MQLPWFKKFSAELVQRMSLARLHHAILLTGSQGIGKHLLAKNLSKQLLCKQIDSQFDACGRCQACNLFDASSHPDFYWLTTEKTQIGVDLIRQAIESLNAKSQLSHNKVLVVPHAHLMTESAANALLKTLEEPTPDTFIILVTHQPNRLLPTILSRCEKHALAAPDADESLTWLQRETSLNSELNPANVEITERLLNAYGRAPLSVLDSLNNDDVLKFSDFSEKFNALLNGECDVFALAGEWQSSSEPVIRWLQRYLRDKQASTQGAHSSAVWTVIEQTNQAALKARHPGTNKAMLLFQLLTAILSLDALCM